MKIVVVGFGFMGVTHTFNILQNSNLQLVAIVDKNSEQVPEKLQENLGNFSTGSLSQSDIANVKVYSDLAECLAAENPDACIISVHTALHYEMAKLALMHGVHAFVEKPFCLDVLEGEELIALAQSKSKTLMVGQVVRFMPAYEKLKELIDSKELGEVEFLTMSRFSGVPTWGQWKEKQKDFGSSGGALFDLVIHDIDYAQWVCGIPDEVNATTLPGKLSNYDYVSAFWRYKNRSLVVKIEGGNTFHSAYPFQAGFSARFSDASLLYSWKDPGNIVVTTDTDTRLIPVGDGNQGFANELNYFVDSIIKNEIPEKCTAESALDAIRLCHRHV
jgi:predicted dehydrogenase